MLLGVRDAAAQWVELKENRLRFMDDSSVEASSEADEVEEEEEEEEEGAGDVSGSEQVSAARWVELESMGREEILLFYTQDEVKLELCWTGYDHRVIVLENILVPEKKRGKGIFRRVLEECEQYCLSHAHSLRVGEIESCHVMLSCWRRGYRLSADSADSGCVTSEQLALLRDKERHRKFLVAINDLVEQGEAETAAKWFTQGRKLFGGGPLKGLDMNKAIQELRADAGIGVLVEEEALPALREPKKAAVSVAAVESHDDELGERGTAVSTEAALAQLLGDDLALD